MEKLISIIIPVFNEPDINEMISRIHIQLYQNYEIIVVDGQIDGSTIRLIEDENCIKMHSKPGRAIQMNTGAKKAKGDILLFLHADSSLPTGGLKMIDKILKSGIIAGAFDIYFDSKNFVLRKIISRTSSIRSRWTKLPYGDQGHFFKKKYFDTIGGYAEIVLMEDIEIMQRVKYRKDNIFIIPHRIKTSDRRWQEEGILYVMLRNPIISMLYLLGVPAEKLCKYYPRAKKYKNNKMEV